MTKTDNEGLFSNIHFFFLSSYNMDSGFYSLMGKVSKKILETTKKQKKYL